MQIYITTTERNFSMKKQILFSFIILLISVLLYSCGDDSSTKEFVYMVVTATPTIEGSKPVKQYKMNELIEYGPNKLKVTGFEENIQDSANNYKTVIVSFEAYTESPPETYDIIALQFIRDCKLTNGYTRSGGCSSPNPAVLPGEWANFETSFRILKEYEIYSVLTRTDKLDLDYDIEVILE